MMGKIYGREWAEEEFRCNYGLSVTYAQMLRSTDLKIAGWDETGETRMVELANHHPFFVGTLFIPRYSSSAAAPHPLICGFVRAAALKGSSSRSRVELLAVRMEKRRGPPLKVNELQQWMITEWRFSIAVKLAKIGYRWPSKVLHPEDGCTTREEETANGVCNGRPEKLRVN